jgi:hypothetical protein
MISRAIGGYLGIWGMPWDYMVEHMTFHLHRALSTSSILSLNFLVSTIIIFLLYSRE